MSSLACKCVFYRQEHNAKGGPHGTECWRSWDTEMRLLMNRARRADEKNGIFF